MKYLMFFCLLFIQNIALAGSVFKCDTPNGIVYQSSPCGSGDKKLTAACPEQNYYGSNSGYMNFTGEDCESKSRKRQAEIDAREKQAAEQNAKSSGDAIKNKRNAFIKATTPKIYKAAFDDCVFNSDEVARLTDGKVISIVNTHILKITKYCSAYGSATITCSLPDEKMIIKSSGNNGCN